MTCHKELNNVTLMDWGRPEIVNKCAQGLNKYIVFSQGSILCSTLPSYSTHQTHLYIHDMAGRSWSL